MILPIYSNPNSDEPTTAKSGTNHHLTSEAEIALQKKGRIPIGDPGFHRHDDGRPGGKNNKRRRGNPPPEMWVR